MRRVARELIGMAHELTGSSKVSSEIVNLLDLYLVAHKKVVSIVKQRLEKIHGVESVDVRFTNRGTRHFFIITAEGYSRSDIAAKCDVILDFSGDYHAVSIADTSPYGRSDRLYEKFDNFFPLGKVVDIVVSVFG